MMVVWFGELLTVEEDDVDGYFDDTRVGVWLVWMPFGCCFPDAAFERMTITRTCTCGHLSHPCSHPPFFLFPLSIVSIAAPLFLSKLCELHVVT
jgi:hypothetical protein